MAITMDVGLHTDPDAQATVTDFLDYTEYLPADIFRSLTLIGNLDKRNISQKNKIHDLLVIYGDLPRLKKEEKELDAEELRRDISYNLELALSARESTYAEAVRLFNEVDRHYKRLQSVASKLEALPKPPSRDPTPVPISPPIVRRPETATVPKITLRMDNARAAASKAFGATQRPRHRRITVPGEVLPPPNPDSPPPGFSESEWESDQLQSPVRLPGPRNEASKKDKSRSGISSRPKLPKLKLLNGPRPPKIPRAPRPPGAMGTNVHSAVAGISTSNALSLLTPPPEDVVPGSKHAPWTRLTEWEMAKLRKRMKKNAIWTPSETMIRRELAESGRGAENYLIAKARCDETGEPFTDFDDLANRPKGQPLKPGEISADVLGLNSRSSNKSMKIHEAKALKKELALRQAAAQAAADADKVARSLNNLGSSFRTLFDKPGTLRAPISTPMPNKRKWDDITSVPSVAAATTSKKRKQDRSRPVHITTTTASVPLAAPGTLPSNYSSSPSTTRKAPSRRLSIILKPPAEPVEAKRAWSSSRRVSTGPDSKATSDRHRTPEFSNELTGLYTAASRRSKRPAPGPVASPDGGAAVTEVRRKSAPKKKTSDMENGGGEGGGGFAKTRVDEEGVEEEIDPNEPRYCFCGDVSYGQMVACDNEDCEREWFHLGCVGLTEPPPRRTKWYCEACKKALKK